MSDITLLGFDPAGIGKEREKMETLKDMSGEELESKFLDLMPLGRVSEFRLELRRRLELAGRIEGRHLVALRNAVHATMPEGELCGDDALEAWPDKLRERAEKAEAERDTLNNALDSICAEFPEYGHTSGHEAAVARCVELINKLKVERDQARAERDGLEILYKAEFKLVTALNGQLSTARTALTEISRLAQRGEEKPEIIMKNRFGLIRIASRGALDALTPPEAATSEKAEWQSQNWKRASNTQRVNGMKLMRMRKPPESASKNGELFSLSAARHWKRRFRRKRAH